MSGGQKETETAVGIPGTSYGVLNQMLMIINPNNRQKLCRQKIDSLKSKSPWSTKRTMGNAILY